jgi:hypothetical protein
MTIICILILVILILLICSIFGTDHFSSINSLNIKYNANNVIIPNQLKKPNNLSLKEKINAELNNQPLSFQKQIYSMPVYPYVGHKQYCLNDNMCDMLSSKCNFDRNYGIGVCTLKYPDKTAFDISY